MTFQSFLSCWLYNWQTVITGGVTLAVGIAAFFVARSQIAVMREQASAADRQISVLQAEFEDTSRRRRIVAEWAGRVDAERPDKGIARDADTGAAPQCGHGTVTSNDSSAQNSAGLETVT